MRQDLTSLGAFSKTITGGERGIAIKSYPLVIKGNNRQAPREYPAKYPENRRIQKASKGSFYPTSNHHIFRANFLQPFCRERRASYAGVS
jgi:hypothetical protein